MKKLLSLAALALTATSLAAFGVPPSQAPSPLTPDFTCICPFTISGGSGGYGYLKTINLGVKSDVAKIIINFSPVTSSGKRRDELCKSFAANSLVEFYMKGHLIDKWQQDGKEIAAPSKNDIRTAPQYQCQYTKIA